MTKVSFDRMHRRIPHPEYGMSHDHRFIACDLARPAAELRALGALMSTVANVGETMVVDAMLYVRSDYDVAHALQERRLHQVLAIARDVLAEALQVLPSERTKPSPRPDVTTETYCGRPSCYVRDAQGHAIKYAVPEGCYEPAMMIVERDGRIEGHLLVSSRYDNARTNLATHLVEMTVPDAGIRIADARVLEEMYLERHVDGIEDLGAACLRLAGGMIEAMKHRTRRLKHEGRPSAFNDEDNDARDVLLGLMAKGAVLTRTRIEDHDHWGDEPEVAYHLDDGTEAPHHVVQRLLEAELIQPSDGPWGESRTLVAVKGLKPDQMLPRHRTVSFDMFQNACRFRRHPNDGEEECVSKDRHGCNSYCESGACPLLDRAYENEYGHSFSRHRSIDDDPAFDYHGLDRTPDADMIARDPRTRRSRAWRYAGSSRMHGVINQVLGSHMTCGIPMLIEAMHDAAVDQAVAEGWLAVDERNPLGSVARVTDKLLGEVERQRRMYEQTAVPAEAQEA